MLACLILIGVALLVRTVAIGQHAYDMLLPSISISNGGRGLTAAVASSTLGAVAVIDTEPVAAPVVSAPTFDGGAVASATPGEGAPANSENLRQNPSEKQKVVPTRNSHRKGYGYRYYGYRFQPDWGAVVW